MVERRASGASGADPADLVHAVLAAPQLDPAEAGIAAVLDADSPGAPPPCRRRFSLHLVATIALGSVLLCLPLVVVGVWATIRVDGRAAERDEALMRAGLVWRIEAVSREQETVTISDDATQRSRAGDRTWMAQHIGGALNEFHGHDLSYVLDHLDRAIHAMRDGQTQPNTRYGQYDRPTLAPLVAEARARLAGARREGADPGRVMVRDLVELGGLPSVASVRPIVPASYRVKLEPGREHLHITVRHIDAEFLAGLERALLIPGALAPDGLVGDGQRTIPLVSAGGAVVGHVAFTPATPGRQLVGDALPGLTTSAVLALIVILYLVRGLRAAVDRLQASELRATRTALHDPLTGLPNRLNFNARLAALRDGGPDGDRGLAVHYVDLDGFKEVNDSLGHTAGDALMRLVAQRMSRIVDGDATIARLGGDEFAVLQTELRGATDAEPIARRLIQGLEPPFEIEGRQVKVACSVGVALGTGWGVPPGEIMRRADLALRQAKGAGKGRYCFFDRSYDEAMRGRRATEQALREALDGAGGLYVVYQPIFDVEGARVLGAEALVRWRHPERGLVSPGDFIGVAEERGLMGRLGDFVMVEACQAARRTGLGWVAVNASASQFREPGFADRVLGWLDAFGLAPQRLQVEITESLLLDASHAVSQAILKLRMAGVKISLDDFGTGFSSLGYLTRLQVDKIKIDRSFVEALETQANGAAVVKAMLDLAMALDLDVTAEGIETEAQWRALTRLGSPELQGFLFSKPLEEADLRDLLDGPPAAAARR